MKIYEITNTLKTYIARVKLNNDSWVKTSVKAENSSHAMQLLKHLYISVSSVSELTEQQDDLEEATETKTPQQLQARQWMAKAQEKMRDATKPLSLNN